jgi:hypothetical protein
MRELRGALTAHQLPGKDVAYSEQGMQGDDYVSCDVGKKFLGAWAAKFNIKWDEVLADPRGIRAACIG